MIVLNPSPVPVTNPSASVDLDMSPPSMPTSGASDYEAFKSVMKAVYEQKHF